MSHTHDHRRIGFEYRPISGGAKRSPRSKARHPTAAGTMKHLVVQGLRTRVEIRGEGPPLLLIMGIWGELAAWDPVLRLLAGFQTIAFDAPGIGDTQVPSYPRPWPEHARFAAGVLDAVGIRRAHVLGMSFGGLVAQQLAILAPDRVDRLVLVSTTSGVLHVPGQPSAMLGLLRPWTSPDVLRDAGSVFGGRIRREPQLMDRLGIRTPRTLAAYLHRLSGLSGWWGLPWTIRQPTLVLTGDDDPIVPSSNSRILAACLPNARLHIIRGGGHLVLFDSPGEVAPLIGGFLREGRTDSRLGRLAS
jgi:pimeloyl-ACP methyl ester carboxylesterase